MRKRLLAVLLFCAACVSARAGEQTLFSRELEHGGYGAPVVRFTSIKSESAVLIGGQGGWILNHTLVIGVGGYGIVTNHSLLAPLDDGKTITRNMNLGYGGLFLGYIAGSDRVVHPTIQLLIGGGTVEPRDRKYDEWDQTHNRDDDDYDGFFMMEPQAGLEINMTTFMRIELNASYRFVNGIEKYGLTESDIDGLSGSLVFKFGRF